MTTRTEPNQFIEQTLDSILTRPRMWGGPEALELQVLMLLELRALLGGEENAGQSIMERYRKFMRAEAGNDTAHLLSGTTSDIDQIVSHLAAFRMQEQSLQVSALVELQAALDRRKAVDAHIVALRRAIAEADEPREWEFSHEHVYQFDHEYPAAHGFYRCTARRGSVEDLLWDRINGLPFDRTINAVEVNASASCTLTGETVEIYVYLDQIQPECLNGTPHEWLIMCDDRRRDGNPFWRKLSEGCPRCCCRKETIWDDAREPSTGKVTYDQLYYPEGAVQRLHGAH